MGALLVGVAYGKALAYARGIPVVGVHHMEGHLFATSLEHPDAVPPFIALLVSGGHTLLLDVEQWGELSTCSARRATTPLARPSTRSRSSSACPTPAARTSSAPPPPAIRRDSASADRWCARNARVGDGDFYDLSFSGLKTAVRLATQKVDIERERANLARGFQDALDRHARRENLARRTRERAARAWCSAAA